MVYKGCCWHLIAHLWCSLMPSDWHQNTHCWHFRFRNNVHKAVLSSVWGFNYFTDVCNNSCNTYRRPAGCSPIDALALGVTLHAGFIHDGLPRLPAKTITKLTDPRCWRTTFQTVTCEVKSPFWGHELNCKHVEIQYLTEICEDKQMWVNVPFQLRCLSYIYWRFNGKKHRIVFGLRFASITNPRTHLMS